MIDQESLNYYKLSKLLIVVGRKVIHEKIKRQCTVNSVTFQQLLNVDSNKHVLYHLWQNSLCCQCKTLNAKTESIKNKRALTKTQWENLYEFSADIHPDVDHEFGLKCICRYKSIKTLTPDALDLSLGTCVFLNLFIKSLDAAQKMDIENLRKYRNSIVAHSQNTTLSSEIFEKSRRDIAGTILSISMSCGSEFYHSIKQEIDDILNLNFIDTKENSTMLNTSRLVYAEENDIVEEFKRLQIAINNHFDTASCKLEELSNTVELFHQSVSDGMKAMLLDMSKAAYQDKEDIKSQMVVWQHTIEQEIFALKEKVSQHCGSMTTEEREKSCLSCSREENNIIECTKIEIEEHRRCIFLPTRALSEGIKKLESTGIVIYKGKDGSGKTACAREILRKIRDGELFTGEDVAVMHLTSVEGIERIVNPSKNVLIFLDDPFENDTGKLKGIFQYLWSLISAGNIRLIMTMSSKTVEVCHQRLNTCNMFDEENIIDISEGTFKLNLEEKKKLLELYARENNVKIVRRQNMENITSERFLQASDQAKIFHKKLEKIAESNPIFGFPLCCSRFFSSRYFMTQGVRYFEQCSDFILRELEVLAGSANESERMQFALLVLMMLQGGIMSIENIETPLALKLGSDLDISWKPYRIKLALKDLKRKGFIKPQETSDVFHFSHAAYFEAVVLTYTDLFPKNLSDLIIKCDFRALTMMKTKQYKKKPNEIVLSLPETYNAKLIERFLLELKNRKFRKIIFHQAMSDKEFVSQFLRELIKDEHQDIIKCRDEHGFTLFELAKYSEKSELLEIAKDYSI